MSINYEYYKVFCCVAELENITRAAEKLCLTQPSVTKSIRALEQQLDCQLFERSRRGVKLTAEGVDLYRKIHPACSALLLAEEDLRRRRSLEQGMVRICTGLPSMGFILIPALRAFQARYPGISIEIRDNHSATPLSGLESGQYDLLMDLAPADSLFFSAVSEMDHIVAEPLWTLRDIPLAAPGLVREGPLSLEALLDYPLIFRKLDTTPTGFYHALLQQKLQRKNGSYLVADALPTRIRMTQAGLGVSFLPRECVETELREGLLVPLSVSEPLLERRIILMTKKNSPRSFAAEAFLRQLRRTLSQT